MAAQLKPELCEHQKVRWNPLTVEPGSPHHSMTTRPKHPMSVGHFLRQTGRCECGVWVVRVTDQVCFGPPRLLRSLFKGVDAR